MTLSRVEWVRAPSKVEGLALAATPSTNIFPSTAKRVLPWGLHDPGSGRRRVGEQIMHDGGG